MKTALNDSRTEASGWWSGTIAGCTRTATSPSRSSATASSFTTYPRAAADSMSSDVMPVMPSQYTSSGPTRAPNAIDAMIAAFDAAS